MPATMHVKTSAGRVAVRVSHGKRSPMLVIHGNSMSSEAFEGLMSSPLGHSYRLIAVDLPGHGASDDAADPGKTYTLAGYADAMLDVLFALDAQDALVLGWSLGGHVAYEMMARSENVGGAFTIAAPPVTPGPSAINGFNVSETFSFFGREQLSREEKGVFAEVIAGAPAPDFAQRALERADGRARRILVESILSGQGADPADLLANGQRPIALVCGEHEFMTSWDFMRALAGPAIWRGGAIAIPKAAHAPFLEAPDAFNVLLLQFLRDAARRRAPQAIEPPTGRRLSA